MSQHVADITSIPKSSKIEKIAGVVTLSLLAVGGVALVIGKIKNGSKDADVLAFPDTENPTE